MPQSEPNHLDPSAQAATPPGASLPETTPQVVSSPDTTSSVTTSPEGVAPDPAVGVSDRAASVLAAVSPDTTADGSAPRHPPSLEIRGLSKRFGDKVAVESLDLVVPAGSFYGLVGPNGAGKTTTLSMATGLLRPDAGEIRIHGVEVWRNLIDAKRLVGVLSDGVRLFDRLTGVQLVTYAGLLSGMDRDVVVERTADLLQLLDLESAGGTLVVDYSAGMTKKIALACALIHAPRLLVLDEPFESVDPVSSANIRDILDGFVKSGGTVIVSSHAMDLVQRMCDHVAIIAQGRVLAAGTTDDVRAGSTLEDRFVDLVGGRRHGEGPEWLRTLSNSAS
jgi:ABC-2 type transport system ATP-binding protein